MDLFGDEAGAMSPLTCIMTYDLPRIEHYEENIQYWTFEDCYKWAERTAMEHNIPYSEASLTALANHILYDSMRGYDCLPFVGAEFGSAFENALRNLIDQQEIRNYSMTELEVPSTFCPEHPSSSTVPSQGSFLLDLDSLQPSEELSLCSTSLGLDTVCGDEWSSGIPFEEADVSTLDIFLHDPEEFNPGCPEPLNMDSNMAESFLNLNLVDAHATEPVPSSAPKPTRTKGRLRRHRKSSSSFSSRSPSPPSVAPPTTALARLHTNSRNRSRGPKSYEYLIRLLTDSTSNPRLVQWVDMEKGVFKLKDPKQIARMWGERSSNKASESLSYDNFARGLRYHYKTNALRPVPDKQLVYKLGPKGLSFLQALRHSP